ncbi:MAG: hypothetical protein SGARI_000117 [Bacillariaceae sp.]
MGDNVLGYNQTSCSRDGKTHTIHLRLRHPRQHDRLFSWEDVAGTMAHELAHCVHGPHNDKFYKLMEEILEEHCMMKAYGPTGPSWMRPVNGNVIQRELNGAGISVTADGSASMPESGGLRLGGKTAGRSRLLDEIDQSGGRKLGGNWDAKFNMSPRQLQELAARAAEARKCQLDLVRRMAERSKEPCVIEICEDDDEDDECGRNKKCDSEETLDKKMPPKVLSKNQAKAVECIDLLDDSNDAKNDTKKPKRASAGKLSWETIRS